MHVHDAAAACAALLLQGRSVGQGLGQPAAVSLMYQQEGGGPPALMQGLTSAPAVSGGQGGSQLQLQGQGLAFARQQGVQNGVVCDPCEGQACASSSLERSPHWGMRLMLEQRQRLSPACSACIRPGALPSAFLS